VGKYNIIIYKTIGGYVDCISDVFHGQS